MPTNTSGRLALATSSLALVVAIGGAGYAAAKIGTADLENNAVTSPKIKNNTVTGRDVKERTLTKVRYADEATFAKSAGDLDGVVIKEIFYHRAENTGPEGVLVAGGFGITALCGDFGDIQVYGATSKQAALFVTAASDVDPADPVGSDMEDFSFTPGGPPVDLLVGTSGNNSTVHITYGTPDGDVVTVDMVADETADECFLHGHAIIS
jgi:hypothetical protein